MLRRHVWWPTVPTHAIAGGIALVAVVALGLLEIPRFTFFKDYASLQASPGEFLTLAAVFSIANACFLYLHARGDYLRTQNALRPILTSFAILSVLLPVIWAVSRYGLKHAPAPDLAALKEGAANWFNGVKLSGASSLEWTRVFRVIFVGEAGLTAILLFSGLWKAPPQDTLDFVGTMSRTRRLVQRVFCDTGDIADQEVDRLEVLLKGLVDSAQKLSARELLEDDLDFANKISKAAGLLLVILSKWPKGTLDGLRNSDNEEMWSAITVLSGGIRCQKILRSFLPCLTGKVRKIGTYSESRSPNL